MIAVHTSTADILTAAERTGVRLREHTDVSTIRTRKVRFTLALQGEKYRRMNHRHDRKVAAVCWHGHRDFFRALFAVNPAAVVNVSARFTGDKIKYTAETFESTYQQTGDLNIGPTYEPCAYRDACGCTE